MSIPSIAQQEDVERLEALQVALEQAQSKEEQNALRVRISALLDKEALQEEPTTPMPTFGLQPELGSLAGNSPSPLTIATEEDGASPFNTSQHRMQGRPRADSLAASDSSADSIGSVRSVDDPALAAPEFLLRESVSARDQTHTSEVSAVTLVPIRVGSSGELEVMMAQNEVYNYYRSRPLGDERKTVAMPWPGEYRFPGGRQKKTDHAPYHTGVRHLLHLLPGVDVSPNEIHATLYKKSLSKNQNKLFHVYTFVCFEQENPWMADCSLDEINAVLERQRAEYWAAVKDGSFAMWSKQKLRSTATRIRRVEWLRVSQAVEMLDPKREFVNLWQQQELKVRGFHHFKRHVSLAAWVFLRDLQSAVTRENFMERCIETVIRRIAATKNLSEEQWRKELYARSGISNAAFFNLNKMRVLSYNLNILPRGNFLFAPTGHEFADARLSAFVEDPTVSGYDVLLIQEVFASPFMPGCRQRHFIRNMRRKGYRHTATSGAPSLSAMWNRYQFTDSGLVILSKFPIVERSFIVFTAGYNLDRGAAKGVVYAKIQFGERFLLVFNTHLQASHVGDGSRAGDVRLQQLQELRAFIQRMCHFNPGTPWILSGDFNIDSIASHTVGDTLGYAWFSHHQEESAEYVRLMRLLSQDYSDVSDLLKESNGGHHPSTRPPRLQLPTSLKYMAKHKYPQRLDYVFFCPGSLGEIMPVRNSASVEKFEVTQHAGPLHSGLVPAERRASYGGASGSDSQLPFLNLSDHYGVGCTLHCLNTVAWTDKGRASGGNVVARASAQTAQQRQRSMFWKGVGAVLVLFLCAWTTFSLFLCVNFPTLVMQTLHLSIADLSDHTNTNVELIAAGTEGCVELLTILYQRFVKRDLLHTLRAPDALVFAIAFPWLVPLAVLLLVLVCVVLPRMRRSSDEDYEDLDMADSVASGVCVDGAAAPGPATPANGLVRGRTLSNGNMQHRRPSFVYSRSPRAQDEARDYFPDSPPAKSFEQPKMHRLQSDGGTRTFRCPDQPDALVARDPEMRHVTTVSELFLQAVKDFGYRECLGIRSTNRHGMVENAYEWQTYDTVYRRVCKFGSGLLKLGSFLNLQPQDRVGILCENRPEWIIVDQACAAFGLVSVPLFSTDLDFLEQLVRNSGVKVVVSSRRWTLPLLRCFEHSVETKDSLVDNAALPLLCVIQLERLEYEEQSAAEELNVRLYDFHYVETKGARYPVAPGHSRPSDVATIVYRTGSDGVTVGCELTHANLIASVTGLRLAFESMRRKSKSLGLTEADVHFSFHPLAHVRERSICLFALRMGMATGFYHGDYGEIFDDMRVLKPTFMVATPGIFGSLFRQYLRIRQGWSPLYRAFFDCIYARKRFHLHAGRYKTRYDWFILRGVASILGGHLRMILLTGGVLGQQLREFVQMFFCCPVVRGLEFPEAAGLISMGLLDDTGGTLDSHHVGVPLVCNELKLIQGAKYQAMLRRPGQSPSLVMDTPSADNVTASSALSTPEGLLAIGSAGKGKLGRSLSREDSAVGELCVRGHNLFRGYTLGAGDPMGPTQVTLRRSTSAEMLLVPEDGLSQSVDKDGWWRTGFVAQWTSGKGITLIGKLSSFVNVNGTHINLGALEQLYQRKCPLARQVWLYALHADDHKSFGGLVAVVSVDHEMFYEWSKKQGHHVYDIQSICEMATARDELRQQLQQVAELHQLRAIEAVRHVILTHISFSTRNRLSTPTGDLRRKELSSFFSRELASLQE